MKKIEVSDIIDFLRRVLDNDLKYITVGKHQHSISVGYKLSDNLEQLRIEIFSSSILSFDKYISLDINIDENQRLELMYYSNKILNKKMEESYKLIDNLYRCKNSSDF